MKRLHLFGFLSFAVIGALTFGSASAHAACTSPAGDEGKVIYNADHKVAQFCNGTDWIGMAGGRSSSAGASVTEALKLEDADNNTTIQVEESADENKIRFDTAGTERMIIDEAGNVGIGTTSPIYKIHVEDGNIMAKDSSNGTGGTFSVLSDDGGINLARPTDATVGGTNGYVDFAGTDHVARFYYSEAQQTMYVTKIIGATTLDLNVNGQVHGNGAYVNTSDARLKTNVASMGYGLDTILGLKPVQFDWIDVDQQAKQGHQIGFIAQDVEKLIPELVMTADDEIKTKSMAYGQLTPVLVKAIQELSAENDALKAQNTAILERLDALEAAQN